VNGLTLNNVSFHLKNDDQRPAIVCEEGKNIEMVNCKIPSTTGAESFIRLDNVDGVLIKNNKAEGSAAAFVRVERSKNGDIKLSKNLTGEVKKEIEFAPDVLK
jgi:hypothetical protein